MLPVYAKLPSQGFWGAIFTTVDQALNWCRLSSVWYLLFGLAC